MEQKPPLLSVNPCPRASELPRLVDKDVEILTPEQVKEMLTKAPKELIPRLALQLFAGIRTEELSRLKWDAVNLRMGVIRVAHTWKVIPPPDMDRGNGLRGRG